MDTKTPRSLLILGVIVAAALIGTVLFAGYANVPSAGAGGTAQVKSCPVTDSKPCCEVRTCPAGCGGACCGEKGCVAEKTGICCGVKNRPAACANACCNGVSHLDDKKSCNVGK